MIINYISVYNYQILYITRRIPFPPVATRPRVVRKTQPPPRWGRSSCPGPRRTTSGLGSSRPEADHCGPGLDPGPKRPASGLDPSRPEADHFGPGPVLAQVDFPPAWRDPGPQRPAPDLDGSKPEADCFGPGSVQGRGGLVRAWIRPDAKVQAQSHVGPRGLLHPLPRW